VLVYSPARRFDEKIDAMEPGIGWIQKSPNGIHSHPQETCFRSQRSGTWVAWRRQDERAVQTTKSVQMRSPNDSCWRRLPLTQTNIQLLSRHVEGILLAVLHSFPAISRDNSDWCIFEEVNWASFARAGLPEKPHRGPRSGFMITNLWLAPAYIRK